ncbi:MAG: tyrosine-protein phosphatase [Burkholderiales bacterium]
MALTDTVTQQPERNTSMVDLHCHFLPGIDDGPATLDEAVAMALAAAENGIGRVVVTPHIHCGRYENDLDSIRPVFEMFSRALEARDVPIRLNFAAEVRIGPEIIEMVESERLPFLGVQDGYRMLLLEFPHGHIPLGSEKMVNWLLLRKIRPVIAHPERNKDVMRNLSKIVPFVEMGCLLQVTAGSIAGNFGPFCRSVCIKLLESGWVWALASDAHNLLHRPPELEAGRAAAEKIVGSAASWAMVRDNPVSILESYPA